MPAPIAEHDGGVGLVVVAVLVVTGCVLEVSVSGGELEVSVTDGGLGLEVSVSGKVLDVSVSGGVLEVSVNGMEHSGQRPQLASLHLLSQAIR
eukprot:CAMPEP_0180704790 /NCGR_PEP_ID=MMETSP1038_2-20121128/7335_1 /TAXON_ID=632150 /ORGANISM="Azadinium spinosum, Strain 3D9" /LENGTH=92 /DNA_ID=CAMNT_0022736629 /DNA_START=548 /DNA_END=826 /DNA_ORIENTATION=-